MLSADISGFTALSEKLAGKGKAGAEEITSLINTCFTALIDSAYDYRGEVIKFGGDALLVLFRGDDHERRCANASLAMQIALHSSPAAKRANLTMTVGASHGPFDVFMVGSGYRELLIIGPAASNVIFLEGEADKGETLISPQIAAHVPDHMLGREHAGGLAVSGAPFDPPMAPDPRPWLGEDLTPFVPPQVVEQLGAFAELGGEHRIVSVGFAMVAGVGEQLDTVGPQATADALGHLIDGHSGRRRTIRRDRAAHRHRRRRLQGRAVCGRSREPRRHQRCPAPGGPGHRHHRLAVRHPPGLSDRSRLRRFPRQPVPADVHADGRPGEHGRPHAGQGRGSRHRCGGVDGRRHPHHLRIRRAGTLPREGQDRTHRGPQDPRRHRRGPSRWCRDPAVRARAGARDPGRRHRRAGRDRRHRRPRRRRQVPAPGRRLGRGRRPPLLPGGMHSLRRHVAVLPVAPLAAQRDRDRRQCRTRRGGKPAHRVRHPGRTRPGSAHPADRRALRRRGREHAPSRCDRPRVPSPTDPRDHHRSLRHHPR